MIPQEMQIKKGKTRHRMMLTKAVMTSMKLKQSLKIDPGRQGKQGVLQS